MPEYKLSQTIITDAEPMRSLASTSTSLITGSESGVLSSVSFQSDRTSYILNPESISIQPGGEGTRHSHHITALLGGYTDNGENVYVTGCKDKLIRVFDQNHQMIHKLSGHDNAVTSLSWLTMPNDDSVNSNGSNESNQKILISGSWDGTAKLWNLTTGQCLATLPGHENTVSVQGLPPTSNGRLATGSAGIAQGNQIMDHKIRLWDVTQVSDSVYTVSLSQTVANDHSGPIRGLAYDATAQMLLSCSNDGTVRVRDVITGETVTTLSFPYESGQAPMLLSVSSLGDGKIVAGAEDGTVVVWDVNSMLDDAVQVIHHPNCVWKVLGLSLNGMEGDFVTVCHDGMLRVFTVEEGRVAPEAERSAFEEEVMKSKAKHSTGPTKEEIAALPKWEMNAMNPGSSEGQVQVFAKNGKAIAAQWSMGSGTWIEVGEVTGSNENAGTIDGVTYDHVFPIEIDVASGGVAKMQIGYNNGDNPFVVAQKFIDDYQLDQGYLAQIADYIRSRVGEPAAPTLGMADAGARSGDVSSGSVPAPMEATNNPQSAAPNYSHLPMKGYKTFETGADKKVLSKVCGKIREFNSSITNNLTQEEASSVLDGLCDTIAATSRYHSTTVTDQELVIVLKMMESWSLEQVFPSIDLARLIVLHPNATASSRGEFWNRVVTCALDKCESLLTSDVQGVPRTAIPMLSFRLFANCFKGGAGSQMAVELNLTRILKCVDSFATSTNKNVRLALATVLLNTSSYLKTTNKYDDTVPELFSITVGNICGSDLFETEAIVRVMVGLGTVLLTGEEFRKRAKTLNMASMVQHVAGKHGSKAVAVATEIQAIL